MKIEHEEVPVTNYRTVYISQDGERYYSRSAAIAHDAAIFANTREVKHDGLFLPDEETWMRVFNITCQEDWNYLYYTEWEQNNFGDKYTGPGWYGSIHHDGGDYADSYEIIKIDSSYFKKYEDYIKELKDLTLSKSMV